MTVLDADVVVKRIVDEAGPEDARKASALLTSPSAPSHIGVETGRALLRCVRNGVMSAEDAKMGLAGISAAVAFIPTETLVDDAFDIALTASVSIYDALYVAAAVQRNTQVLTADTRLVAGLRGTPWQARAALLGDWIAAATKESCPP